MTSIDLLELRSPTQPRQITVRILLALLLVWSFGLRLWYATPDLNSTRFWDERYGLENLEPLLKEGQLRPVHGFHPGFSYLPHGAVLKTSDLLYQATGWERLAIFDNQGRYTPTTYMICRTISVLFGTLTLLFVFLIGRRLGGSRLGLLAAFLLSVVPWHLRQSILFKADITLLFTVMLTFYLSLRAIERPTVRSFLTAGSAIGLALSAKFNAGPVALPLMVGAFLTKGSKRRAFLLLAGAAAVSVAVFLILQPYVLIDPDIYRRSMRRTSRVYEKVAQRHGHGRLFLFWHLIRSLCSTSFHGPVVGLLAVVGLATLVVLSCRHLRQSKVALAWIMVLSYVVGYTTLYALATPRPSPHNWLPISLFAALGAAWALLAIWLLVSERLSASRALALGASAATLLVLTLSWQAIAHVYRDTVPRTGDRVLELFRHRLRSPPGRQVLTEHYFQIKFYTRHRKGRLAITTFGNLNELSTESLNRVDAEVFPASQLEHPEFADFYRDRRDRLPPENVVVIEPRPFRARGPSLVALLHPWKQSALRAGEWVRSDDDPLVYIARLPEDLAARRPLSVEFNLRRSMEASEILVEDQQVELVEFRGPRRQTHLVTTRFRYAPEITLQMTKARGPDRIPFTVRRWRQGKSTRQTKK